MRENEQARWTVRVAALAPGPAAAEAARRAEGRDFSSIQTRAAGGLPGQCSLRPRRPGNNSQMGFQNLVRGALGGVTAASRMHLCLSVAANFLLRDFNNISFDKLEGEAN